MTLEEALETLGLLETWRAPWRVVVVGRTSVGKSTLVNRVAGERVRPTGLGGVTREPAEVVVGDGIWVDTPPLEEASPDLAEADQVVWVVDGLQPVTLSERTTLREALPEGTPLEVRVSRFDLVDPAEHAAILDRVRALAPPARSVLGLDLRRDPLALDRPERSPRRVRALRAAILELRETLPEVLDPTRIREEARAAWRALVQEAEAAVERAVREQDVWHRDVALRRLRDEARGAVEGFAVPGVGPVHMPLPDPPAGRPVEALLGGLGGAESALRNVRAQAGRWLMDGELTLADALSHLDDLPEVTTRRQVEEAIEAALTALQGSHLPWTRDDPHRRR